MFELGSQQPLSATPPLDVSGATRGLTAVPVDCREEVSLYINFRRVPSRLLRLLNPRFDYVLRHTVGDIAANGGTAGASRLSFAESSGFPIV